AGRPLRGDPAEGLGRQPHLGRGASTGGADVGVADMLAAGAFGPGLPQSTASRRAGGLGLAPVSRHAHPPLAKKPFAIAYPMIPCVNRVLWKRPATLSVPQPLRPRGHTPGP